MTVVKGILGQNAYHLIMPLEDKSGRNQPWAVKTALVWTISGALPNKKKLETYLFLATFQFHLNHWQIRRKKGGT